MIASLAHDLDAERQARHERRVRETRKRWRGCRDPDAIIDALKRYAEIHGKAPARADWAAARDPDGVWPRCDRVTDIFRKLAHEHGARRFVHERCEHCTCQEYGRNVEKAEAAIAEALDEAERVGLDGLFWVAANETFTPERGCPHGQNGYWEGPSGWRYALECAGLAPRTGADHMATASGLGAHGRNRQMVTGGAHDVKKPILIGIPSNDGR